ncbi:hypothetical protein GCM10007352_00830 [Mucilaginibacter phyllosphaerae]|uniref:Uncharacterized protein n=1 Tax=Mucilaginibacter phyllosphaerae TaxID=1812349 RepID=A0ABR6I5L0_9SPHI|nr:hypothetical protein [Mucilaginibacter phyllosphaerae]GGG99804.1 hypothetical protein GCM10007352_00830 [Mucilaginibacter phyllosphaerae]
MQLLIKTLSALPDSVTSCKNITGNVVIDTLKVTDVALKHEITNANGQLKVE